MPTVAEQLREARERLKLSVYDIAEATKIKTDHVRALEEGNYEVFAAPVYIRGFVRTCATLLKLDVPKVMADLESELLRTERFSEPPHLAGAARSWVDSLLLQVSKVPWQWAVLVLGLVILLGLGWIAHRTWQHMRERDPFSGLGPGLYRPPTNSGETLPIPVPVPRSPN